MSGRNFAVDGVLKLLAEHGQLNNKNIWENLIEMFPDEYKDGLLGGLNLNEGDRWKTKKNLSFRRILETVRADPHVKLIGESKRQSLVWSSNPIVNGKPVGSKDALLNDALRQVDNGNVDIAKILKDRAINGNAYVAVQNGKGQLSIVPQTFMEEYDYFAPIRSQPPDVNVFLRKLKKLIKAPKDDEIRELQNELKELSRKDTLSIPTMILQQTNYMFRSIDLDSANVSRNFSWVRSCLRGVGLFFEYPYDPNWRIDSQPVLPLELHPRCFQAFQDALAGIYMGSALNYAVKLDERYSRIEKSPEALTISTGGGVPQPGQPMGQQGVTIIREGALNRISKAATDTWQSLSGTKKKLTRDLMDPKYFHPLREYKDGLIHCLNKFGRRHLEVYMSANFSEEHADDPDAWAVWHRELSHYFNNGLYRFIDAFTSAAKEDREENLLKLKREMGQIILTLQGFQEGWPMYFDKSNPERL